MDDIPDWDMTIVYQEGCVVFGSDDIAYIALSDTWFINVNQDPLDLFRWKVWKRRVIEYKKVIYENRKRVE